MHNTIQNIRTILTTNHYALVTTYVKWKWYSVLLLVVTNERYNSTYNILTLAYLLALNNTDIVTSHLHKEESIFKNYIDDWKNIWKYIGQLISSIVINFIAICSLHYRENNKSVHCYLY